MDNCKYASQSHKEGGGEGGGGGARNLIFIVGVERDLMNLWVPISEFLRISTFTFKVL